MNRFVIFSYDNINDNYVLKKMMSLNLEFHVVKSTLHRKYIKIKYEEFLILEKYDYKKVVKYERTIGIYAVKEYTKKNIAKFTVTLLIILNIYLSSFLIIKVNIKTDDQNLKYKINSILMDENVEPISIKKDFSRIDKIKKELLMKFNSELEWIEIEKKGYMYNIYLIKRKNVSNNKKNNRCNYVAKKSGNIKSIIAHSGVLLVQENNYVNAGDILISGEIIYNEEIKNNVCASGYITAEVWYKVNTSYPLRKTRYYYDKYPFYNVTFNLFGKQIKMFKPKYNYEKTVKKIGNNNIGIMVKKSYRKRHKKIQYSVDVATKKAIKFGEKSLMRKLPRNSKIISENILKKEQKNDKILIELLVAVEEEIGVVENY